MLRPCGGEGNVLDCVEAGAVHNDPDVGVLNNNVADLREGGCIEARVTVAGWRWHRRAARVAHVSRLFQKRLQAKGAWLTQLCAVWNMYRPLYPASLFSPAYADALGNLGRVCGSALAAPHVQTPGRGVHQAAGAPAVPSSAGTAAGTATEAHAARRAARAQAGATHLSVRSDMPVMLRLTP